MAVPVVTIAGATKTLRERSLYLSETANGRAALSFSVVSTDGSYRPALDAEVIITEAGNRIFGGLVERPTEEGVMRTGYSAGIITAISCVDFNSYADRRLVNGTFASATLKANLTILVNDYLDDHGVTLDAGQVNGPTLPELTYEYARLSDVLNEWMTLTASVGDPYVWRIDYFKVLSAYQPSSEPAPFDIVNNTPAQVIGDVIVEETRKDYANRVIVKTPSKTEYDRVETFIGDGVTTVFNVQYTTFSARGYVLLNGVVQSFGDGVQFPTSGGTQWVLDRVAQTLTANTATPAPGDVIEFPFDGTYAGFGLSEDAGEIASIGLYEKVVVVDAVPTDTTAQALADAYLARSLHTTKTVRYRTHASGFFPGQEQSIVLSRRNLNGTAVVTDVITRDLGKDILTRDLTLVIDTSQTNLGRGWRDVYKLWSGLGGTSSATATAIGAGGGVPPTVSASPVNYVLKTADTSRSSTTPTDDPHLTFPVAANTTYKVEIWLILESISNSNDWKIGVSVPAAATFQWGAESDQSPNWGPLPLAGTPVVLSSAAGTIGTGGNGSGITGAVFKGVLTTSGTAGAFTLQWSQNTAGVGGNSTVKTGSFIEYAALS